MSATPEYQREWRARNADRERRKARERYRLDPATDIARRIRNYRARNPLTPRTCPTCGDSFTPPQRNQQRYCSVDCRRQTERRAIPKSMRRRILRRDDWTCYICSDPIPQDVAWPHPLSGTADHVIPWIAGGKATLDNLRAAHWTCNRRKAGTLLEAA